MTGQEVTAYAGGNNVAMALGYLAAGLDACFFVIFVAGLFELARSIDRASRLFPVAAGLAGGVMISLFLIGTALIELVRRNAGHIGSPDVIQMANDLSKTVFHSSVFPMGALAAFASAVLVRANTGLRWYGWAGCGVGAVALVVQVPIVLGVRGADAVGISAFMLWVLALSVHLLVGRGRLAIPSDG